MRRDELRATSLLQACMCIPVTLLLAFGCAKTQKGDDNLGSVTGRHEENRLKLKVQVKPKQLEESINAVGDAMQTVGSEIARTDVFIDAVKRKDMARALAITKNQKSVEPARNQEQLRKDVAALGEALQNEDNEGLTKAIQEVRKTTRAVLDASADLLATTFSTVEAASKDDETLWRDLADGTVRRSSERVRQLLKTAPPAPAGSGSRIHGKEVLSKNHEALAAQRTEGNEIKSASYLSKGRALADLGRHSEALVEYGKASETYERSNTSERQKADSLIQSSLSHLALRREGSAWASQKAALAIYEAYPATSDQIAELALSLGLTLASMNALEEARSIEAEATAVLQRGLGSEASRADWSAAYGRKFLQLNLREEAFSFESRALALYEKATGREPQRAACMKDLGSLLGELGREEEAIVNYREVLAIYSTIPETERELAAVKSRISELMLETGRYKEAIENQEEALRLLDKVPQTERDRQECVMRIGMALEGMDRPADALARYEEALKFYDRAGGSAMCLGHIGSALRKMGSPIGARTKLRQALEIEANAWLYLELARALEAVGSPMDLHMAAITFEKAASLVDTSRNQYYSTEARLSASSQAAPVYSHVARFLVNRSRGGWDMRQKWLDAWATSSDPRKRCLEAAFHFADAGKARTLIELILNRDMNPTQDAKAQAILAEDRGCLARLGRVHERLLALAPDATELRLKLKQELWTLENRRREIETELKRTYMGKFAVPEHRKVAEIQKDIPGDTAVLEYVVTEDDSRLIVLTRQSLEAFDIPVRANTRREALGSDGISREPSADATEIGLQGLVQLYRAPLDMAQADQNEDIALRAGLELARFLLPEDALAFLARERVRHLVVIPDGPLHTVSFATLPIETPIGNRPGKFASCKFLIEMYRVSYLPSWSMADALSASLKEPRTRLEQKELLAIVDPICSADDARWQKTAPGPLSPVELTALLRGCCDRLKWKRLPETEQEARKVAGAFGRFSVVDDPSGSPAPDCQAVIFTGLAASSKALEGAKAYRRILLATHGLADPRNAWLSCILLTPAGGRKSDAPAYLRAAEIMNTRLDAELVTASACETGLGHLQRGEGIVGLSSAFLIAGARCLALTLWKVPSIETSEVSVRFHALLRDNAGKAEALRMAQLEFLSAHPEKRHPFWWGAFILVGDWR